jgi:hypothetical protein
VVIDAEHNRGITYPALIDSQYQFVYVPAVEGIWFYPRVIPVDGKDTVYCSVRNYRTLDPGMFAELSEAQRYSAMASLKYLRNWVNFKVDNVSGCIDWGVFDDKSRLTVDFMLEAAKVVKTKVFEFMQEIPRNKLIQYCLIAALGGAFGATILVLLIIAVILRIV